MPLPQRGFDPTEAAVPWKILTRAGYQVVIATQTGAMPEADPLTLDGVPFGLAATADAVALYDEMKTSPEFRRPIAWEDVVPSAHAGLVLPGGHAPGMRPYLESMRLQSKILAFWRLQRPVAAICHGVLPLARTIDPDTRKSLLHGVRTTCLPKYMERAAYVLTEWKLGRHYRTYPAYVQDEVVAALASPAQFERGPLSLIRRGTDTDDRPAFVVEDGRYLSARWPGDAYLLAKRFVQVLELHAARGQTTEARP